ncbi:MAG: ATP-binding protein [Gammaproteobacteria bacterium WSBS_2016_MAG_OTU1]
MKPRTFYLLLALPLTVLILTQVIIFQQSPLAGEWLYPLLIVNVVLIVLMLGFIITTATIFFRQWRKGAGGSQLASRLIGLFLAMAFLPTAGLYLVSASSVFRGIESWFSTPLGRAFEEGIAFGQHVLGQEFRRLEGDARNLALAIDSGRSLPFWRDDLQLLYKVDDIAIYDKEGSSSLSALTEPANALGAPVLKTLADGKVYRTVSANRRSLEVAMLLPYQRSGYALRVTRALPEGIAEGLIQVEQGGQQYQKLLILRRGLLYSFMATLTLAFTIVLAGALWGSSRLGARLFKPLSRMAAAATAVGRGDFTYRLPGDAKGDEIARLGHAFNSMVDDLGQSRIQSNKRQAALSQANAYLENLLSSLTAGVLTVNANGQLEQYNAAAESLLSLSLSSLKSKHFSEWETLPTISTIVGEFMNTVGEDVAEQGLQDSGRMLMVRLRRLPHAGGVLVMIDDISRQIEEEREAVWEEASQRFAHEIKNPLTPIQLASERLQNKLSSKLEGEDKKMLDRLSTTIIKQVDDMREIVDDFRLYASNKSGHKEEVDLNDMVAELVGLYERPGLEICRQFTAEAPRIYGNPVALRQALHNILGNAADAVAESPTARIMIQTAIQNSKAAVIVEDNGGGIAPNILADIFKPYQTTKEQGTGLGLAIVRKIMKDNGGEARLENITGGARATLIFS